MQNHKTVIRNFLLSSSGFGIGGRILQKRNVTLKFLGENFVSTAEVRNFQQSESLELPRGGNLLLIMTVYR